ncbi:MAG: DUF4910 domain-containing protein [Rhodothermaceae bacterium]|nr:DUF4910 domain-containing protein [Rhodothermaceae bacterium]
MAPTVVPPRFARPSVCTRGERLHRCVSALYPLHRCITGEGLRATLQVIGQKIPLAIREVPTGTPVLDWAVPKEWEIREAWIATADGRRIVDLAASPLHVIQYSTPVRARMTLRDLRPYLHTLPDQPDLVPYRTSYYHETWGFCLAQHVLDDVAEGGEDQELQICIDSRLFEGALSYGECVIPGESEEEILFSAHACHPALANDNASALAVATALARDLLDRPRRRYTYRFLFAPGTIGALTWLAQNQDRLHRIRHGLVLANLGDAGGLTYKQTRRGTLGAPLPIDRAVAYALRESGVVIRPFEPTGYDERQFGSPGFDLPVGRLTRTPHGEYPEYHTSGDTPALLTPEALEASFDALIRIVDVLEGDAVYRNTQPYGEPQLGRRGLYRPTGGPADTPAAQRALLWVLNLSDGAHSLLDIAEQAALPFATVRAAADRLLDADLLTSPSFG